MASYRGVPTIVPFHGFNAAEDAQALRGAMKGFGTDEDAIIDILTKRTNDQRQQISKVFSEEFGRDLIEDLKSELGGKFESVIVGLMMPPVQYLAKQLNKAMKGIGTDECTIIEILCTKTKFELQKIVEAYEQMYDRPLAEHICSETSGDFRRFLTLLVTGVRDPPGSVNHERAKEDAENLYAAGEGKFGTDEEVFNKILARSSHDQLKLVFNEYKQVSGKTIEQALKAEVDGPLLEGYLAVVECVQSPVTFFAKQLHKAIEGHGTDDNTLIRIIVSRSEIDLGSIKQEYEKLYDKTLESDVTDEISGDFKKIILAIIGGA